MEMLKNDRLELAKRREKKKKDAATAVTLAAATVTTTATTATTTDAAAISPYTCGQHSRLRFAEGAKPKRKTQSTLPVAVEEMQATTRQTRRPPVSVEVYRHMG